ncbi:hypothetical protein ACLMJK_005827 [Lecanora helva]
MAAENSNALQMMLPEGGLEISGILDLEVNGKHHILGSLKEDFAHPKPVVVRLGTKVSDEYPSALGFRVLLRTRTPRSNDTGLIDDLFHVISCHLDPQSGTVVYGHASAQDVQALRNSRRFGAQDLETESDEGLYYIKCCSFDANTLLISRHGPALQAIDDKVEGIEKLVLSVPEATQLSLFFKSDRSILSSLAKAVERGFRGILAPDWRIALPDTVVKTWHANVQTQMAIGLTEVLNVALSGSYRRWPDGGAGTSIEDRPEAVVFKEYVRNAYPHVWPEPENKVYPVMLHVPAHGRCIELPFGGSMINRTNTYVGLGALHSLLAEGIPSTRIGIVSLYPTQVSIYKDVLAKCHEQAPGHGYDLVECDIVENWVGKTTGIVIVDLVRAANAGGNLGYLSQLNRLIALLSIHENGLIVVGDRACVVSSQGRVVSAKLNKILQWFIDHNRIVSLAFEDKYTLYNRALTMPATMSSLPLERAASTDTNASFPRTSSMSSTGTKQPRRYVGIPGLEHLSAHKPSASSSSPSISAATNPDTLTLHALKQDVQGVKEAPNSPGTRQPFSFTFDPAIALKGSSKKSVSNILEDKHTMNKDQATVGQKTSSVKVKQTFDPAKVHHLAAQKDQANIGKETLPTMTEKASNVAKAPYHATQSLRPSLKDNVSPAKAASNLPPHKYASAMKENAQPVEIKSSQDAQLKAEKVALPPHRAKLAHQSSASTQKVSKGTLMPLESKYLPEDPITIERIQSKKEPEAPVHEQPQPNKAESSKTPANPSITQVTKAMADINLTAPPPPPPTPVRNPFGNVPTRDWKIRAEQKYLAVLTRFRAFDPKMAGRNPAKEDRYFRRLAEALFVDKKEGAFNRAYVSAIGIAAKLETAVLRRTGNEGSERNFEAHIHVQHAQAYSAGDKGD